MHASRSYTDRTRLPGIRAARGWLLVGGGLAMSAIAAATGPEPFTAKVDHRLGSVAQASKHTPVDAVRFEFAADSAFPPPADSPVKAAVSSASDRAFPVSTASPTASGLEPKWVPVRVALVESDTPLRWASVAPVTGWGALPAGHEIVAAMAPTGEILVRGERGGAPDRSAVAIEQVATVAQGREDMLQLSETRAISRMMLADAAAIMQVGSQPALAQADGARAAMLAVAPDQLTVRIDGDQVGTVAIAMTEAQAVTVNLGSLLDVVASRMDPAEYENLRASAGANAFVTLDRLRDAGIAAKYDPAYDELVLGV